MIAHPRLVRPRHHPPLGPSPNSATQQADDVLPPRADGAQACGLRMRGVVEAGGVLGGQHERALAHAFQGGLLVGVTEGRGLKGVILEEAVGPLGCGSGTTGLGKRGRGLVGEGGGDHEQARGPAVVAQFGVAEFGEGPSGGWCRGRTNLGCAIIKHPSINYISR